MEKHTLLLEVGGTPLLILLGLAAGALSVVVRGGDQADGSGWLSPVHAAIRLFRADTPAGRAARRLFPAALIAPLPFAWLVRFLEVRGVFDGAVAVLLLATASTAGFLSLSYLHTRSLERLSSQRAESERRFASLLQKEESANRELERVTHRLKLATRAAQIGIWEWELSSDTLTWDPLMASIYRTAESELTKPLDGFWSHVREADVARVREAIRRAIDLNQDFDIDFHIRRGDDAERVIAARALVERDASGTALRMMGTNLDITERREAEIRLARSEQLFRSAMEYSAIGMALVGLDGRFMKVNHPLCELLGYSADELLNVTFQSLTHPDDLAADVSQAERLRSGEILHYHMEKRYIRKDGRIVWVLLSGSAARDDLGNALHYIAQVQDITQRKQTESRLRDSLAEKDVLLREIHHRVKNNLQIIISILRLQSYDSDPQQQRVFKECQARVQTMALIHERLYRSGNLSTVDFGEHLRELATMLARTYRDRSERVALELDVEPIALDIDNAISLGLIANEIITNAFTHAFVGREQGKLSISLSMRDAHLRLCIADDGVGLPQQIEWVAGNSLGLRLIQALAKQLRATLTVESTNGATFAIDLPLPPRD